MSKIKKALAVLAILTLIIPAANSIVQGNGNTQLNSSILILYDQRDQNALNWYNFLKNYGYNVSIQSMQIIFANPILLKNFRLIILDNTTNNLNGDRWKTEEYKLLADQKVPLIANGFGGWLILKLSGVNSMRLYDKTSYLKVNLEDYNLSIFHSPYELDFINQSSILLLKISDTYYNSTFFLPADIPMLKTYYYRYSDCAIGKYEGYSNNTNIFFSFIYDPSALSENGRRAYVNLVENALSRQIIKEKTFLTIISDDILFVNEEYTIIFKLIDEKGNGVNAPIRILFNNIEKQQAYTNSEGVYKLNYTPGYTDTGLIEITAYFEGNQIYESSYSMKDIIIEEKRVTFLNLTGPSLIVYGEKAYYTAILTEENGSKLSGKNIKFYVNSLLICEGVTDLEGKIIFEYTPSKLGKIVLKCIFNGEKEYYPCYSNELECEITAPSLRNTVLTLKTPKTAIVNESVLIETKLLDSSMNPLENKNIYLLLNNQVYNIGVTDLNGCENFSVIFNQSGYYNITVLYPGDGEYSKSKKTSLLVVDRIPTKILLTIEKITTNSVFKINLKLLSEFNQPISNQTITVYLNDVKLQSLITDEYGSATYTVNLGEGLKSIKIEFKYNGDEIYKSCSETCELTVENGPAENGVPLGLTAITCCAVALTIILRKLRIP